MLSDCKRCDDCEHLANSNWVYKIQTTVEKSLFVQHINQRPFYPKHKTIPF